MPDYKLTNGSDERTVLFITTIATWSRNARNGDMISVRISGSDNYITITTSDWDCEEISPPFSAADQPLGTIVTSKVTNRDLIKIAKDGWLYTNFIPVNRTVYVWPDESVNRSQL